VGNDVVRSAGERAVEETELQVFDSLPWTKAHKRDAWQYRPGRLNRLLQSKGGFAKDETVLLFHRSLQAMTPLVVGSEVLRCIRIGQLQVARSLMTAIISCLKN
jgi:hypothetical protein